MQNKILDVQSDYGNKKMLDLYELIYVNRMYIKIHFYLSLNLLDLYFIALSFLLRILLRKFHTHSIQFTDCFCFIMAPLTTFSIGVYMS